MFIKFGNDQMSTYADNSHFDVKIKIIKHIFKSYGPYFEQAYLGIWDLRPQQTIVNRNKLTLVTLT